ncbi:MAG TPA: bifunctional nuclease domain-containing protein [Myxococcales bacterium]|nr:bifunctional nuclease domain-containing protein [Myxococcales bacterium]
MGERASKVAGLLAAAGLGTVAGLFLAAGPKPFERLLGAVRRPAEVLVQEVVHGTGGHDALILREKDGERRVIVPLSAGESRTLIRILRARAAAPATPLGQAAAGARAATVKAGRRLLRASIDAVSREHVFSAHLTMDREPGPVDLESPPADAVALALERGAPIWMSRDVLDCAGVTPEDARALTDSMPAREKAPAPGSQLVIDI